MPLDKLSYFPPGTRLRYIGDSSGLYRSGLRPGDLGTYDSGEDYVPGLDAGRFVVTPDSYPEASPYGHRSIAYWTFDEMSRSWEPADKEDWRHPDEPGQTYPPQEWQSVRSSAKWDKWREDPEGRRLRPKTHPLSDAVWDSENPVPSSQNRSVREDIDDYENVEGRYYFMSPEEAEGLPAKSITHTPEDKFDPASDLSAAIDEYSKRYPGEIQHQQKWRHRWQQNKNSSSEDTPEVTSDTQEPQMNYERWWALDVAHRRYWVRAWNDEEALETFRQWQHNPENPNVQGRVELALPGGLDDPLPPPRQSARMRLAMPYHDNTWYHVTDRSSLPRIQQEGLYGSQAGTPRVWGEYPVEENAVYLHPNIGSAWQYARAYGPENNRQPGRNMPVRWQDPTILRIKNLDYNNLAPDHESINTLLENLGYNEDDPDDPMNDVVAWIDQYRHQYPEPLGYDGEGRFHNENKYYINMLREMPPEYRTLLAEQSSLYGETQMNYGPISPHQIEVGHALPIGDDYNWEDTYNQWRQTPHAQEWPDDEDEDMEGFNDWLDTQPTLSDEDLGGLENWYDDPEDDSLTSRFQWTPLKEWK